MKQKVITIFGGSGFLGRYVVRKLASSGAYLNIVSRTPELAQSFKPAGAVGQMSFTYGDILDEGSVRKALENSDVVINLVGILFEKGKQKFNKIHHEGAETLARVAKEVGVTQFIQLSALGVDRSDRAKYNRSKFAGENAVKAIFRNAVIIRPSVLFGMEDNFFNKFSQIADTSPFLPLIGGGDTLLQPVYVGDVADAIAQAALTNEMDGKIYELGGPMIYTLRNIMEFVEQATNKNRILLPIPYFFASFMVFFLGFLPKPPLTMDQVRLLKSDNVVGKAGYTFSDLGIVPNSIDIIVPEYLR